MKKRSLFRRMNRGIVLAIALVIGLSAYLVVDAVRFAAEEDAIMDMMTAYAREAESVMILSQNGQAPAEKIPEDRIEQHITQSKEKLQKYLSESSPYGSTLGMAQSALESLKEDNRIGAYVTECQLDIVRISGLRKVGPNMARGDIQIHTSIRTIGYPTYLRLFFPEKAGENTYGIYYGTYGFNGQYPQSGSTETQMDTEPHTYTPNDITYTDVIFKKVDGTWKVYQVNGYTQ